LRVARAGRKMAFKICPILDDLPFHPAREFPQCPADIFPCVRAKSGGEDKIGDFSRSDRVRKKTAFYEHGAVRVEFIRQVKPESGETFSLFILPADVLDPDFDFFPALNDMGMELIKDGQDDRTAVPCGAEPGLFFAEDRLAASCKADDFRKSGGFPRQSAEKKGITDMEAVAR